MAALEALLFDVDGTLADTERDGHRVAFNQAFAEAGLDWHWDEALYGDLLAVTGGKERMHHYVARHHPTVPVGANLDALVRDLHQEKTRRYTAMLARGQVSLRPGIQRLIESARAAHVRLAIATTTSPDNVTALLTNALAPDAIEWFEFIAAGDMVPAKKPAPDVYRLALEQMGLDPVQGLALEDSANGVRASVGAGLTTVVTVNDYTVGDDLSGAALVLDALGEPDQPCRVLAGDAFGARYVDLDLLRRVHAESARTAHGPRASGPPARAT